MATKYINLLSNLSADNLKAIADNLAVAMNEFSRQGSFLATLTKKGGLIKLLSVLDDKNKELLLERLKNEESDLQAKLAGDDVVVIKTIKVVKGDDGAQSVSVKFISLLSNLSADNLKAIADNLAVAMNESSRQGSFLATLTKKGGLIKLLSVLDDENKKLLLERLKNKESDLQKQLVSDDKIVIDIITESLDKKEETSSPSSNVSLSEQAFTKLEKPKELIKFIGSQQDKAFLVLQSTEGKLILNELVAKLLKLDLTELTEVFESLQAIIESSPDAVLKATDSYGDTVFSRMALYAADVLKVSPESAIKMVELIEWGLQKYEDSWAIDNNHPIVTLLEYYPEVSEGVDEGYQTQVESLLNKIKNQNTSLAKALQLSEQAFTKLEKPKELIEFIKSEKDKTFLLFQSTEGELILNELVAKLSKLDSTGLPDVLADLKNIIESSPDAVLKATDSYGDTVFSQIAVYAGDVLKVSQESPIKMVELIEWGLQKYGDSWAVDNNHPIVRLLEYYPEVSEGVDEGYQTQVESLLNKIKNQNTSLAKALQLSEQAFTKLEKPKELIEFIELQKDKAFLVLQSTEGELILNELVAELSKLKLESTKLADALENLKAIIESSPDAVLKATDSYGDTVFSEMALYAEDVLKVSPKSAIKMVELIEWGLQKYEDSWAIDNNHPIVKLLEYYPEVPEEVDEGYRIQVKSLLDKIKRQDTDLTKALQQGELLKTVYLLEKGQEPVQVAGKVVPLNSSTPLSAVEHSKHMPLKHALNGTSSAGNLTESSLSGDVTKLEKTPLAAGKVITTELSKTSNVSLAESAKELGSTFGYKFDSQQQVVHLNVSTQLPAEVDQHMPLKDAPINGPSLSGNGTKSSSKSELQKTSNASLAESGTTPSPEVLPSSKSQFIKEVASSLHSPYYGPHTLGMVGNQVVPNGNGSYVLGKNNRNHSRSQEALGENAPKDESATKALPISWPSVPLDENRAVTYVPGGIAELTSLVWDIVQTTASSVWDSTKTTASYMQDHFHQTPSTEGVQVDAMNVQLATNLGVHVAYVRDVNNLLEENKKQIQANGLNWLKKGDVKWVKKGDKWVKESDVKWVQDTKSIDALEAKLKSANGWLTAANTFAVFSKVSQVVSDADYLGGRFIPAEWQPEFLQQNREKIINTAEVISGVARFGLCMASHSAHHHANKNPLKVIMKFAYCSATTALPYFVSETANKFVGGGTLLYNAVNSPNILNIGSTLIYTAANVSPLFINAPTINDHFLKPASALLMQSTALSNDPTLILNVIDGLHIGVTALKAYDAHSNALYTEFTQVWNDYKPEFVKVYLSGKEKVLKIAQELSSSTTKVIELGEEIPKYLQFVTEQYPNSQLLKFWQAREHSAEDNVPIHEVKVDKFGNLICVIRGNDTIIDTDSNLSGIDSNSGLYIMDA